MLEISSGHNVGFPGWLSGVVFVWCWRKEVKRGVQERGSSAGGKNCANLLCSLSKVCMNISSEKKQQK